MSEGKIVTLLVARDDAVVEPYYGYEYKGKTWLVTAWLLDKGRGIAEPERTILLDASDLQGRKVGPPEAFDYAGVQLPKAVIDGQPQGITGYEVRDRPGWPIVNLHDLKPLPNLSR